MSRRFPVRPVGCAFDMAAQVILDHGLIPGSDMSTPVAAITGWSPGTILPLLTIIPLYSFGRALALDNKKGRIPSAGAPPYSSWSYSFLFCQSR